MPAKSPISPSAVASSILDLGQKICARRKALGINVVTAAQAGGMSRVTWHRIEKGEPSVTVGAYLNAAAALGLRVDVGLPGDAVPAPADTKGWIPARVRLADYPQLKQLAWQVQGTDALTPVEALSIYERNARHLDTAAIDVHEQDLIDALRLGLGGAANGGSVGRV
jgi:transcriptional regulator with XRE-family HTH domain